MRQDTFHLPKTETQLTQRDYDFIRTLKTACFIDHIDTFTSDTFRMLNLDRFLTDKQHSIGSFFARLVANDVAEAIGWKRSTLPSNHGRTIRIYRFRPK